MHVREPGHDVDHTLVVGVPSAATEILATLITDPHAPITEHDRVFPANGANTPLNPVPPP